MFETMEEKEIWLTVKGFEGFYEVSNKGRIRSVDRWLNNGHRSQGRIVYSHPNKRNGHLQVMLHKNLKYKMMYVKRLVAEAFVDNPSGYTFTKIVDGDKTNCSAENIVWVENNLSKVY